MMLFLKDARGLWKSTNVLYGGCQSEKSPLIVRYGDGQLYYEGEWFHKGDHVLIESRNDTNSRKFVLEMKHFCFFSFLWTYFSKFVRVWVRKEDGSKTKLFI
ncbi:breast cancer metastasis-suppressor 1-like protein [Pocillopora verrucosa]|uniref:breast cancer metastasis-suppressor 1-like protein n=1 Tax=Pocillopora verrucosa TaxID=203993 RepID=UPI003342005E